MEVRARTKADTSQEARDAIVDIYDFNAFRSYGLCDISQREHALQAATLAMRKGCDDALVLAALLHDGGHMVHDLEEDPAARGIDDHHEKIGADWISQFFVPAVSEPVKLHVAAKRYLCAIEPDYFRTLSADSIQSLCLQGGVMTREEINAFEALPWYVQATELRRLDEAAKQRDAVFHELSKFKFLMDRLVKNP